MKDRRLSERGERRIDVRVTRLKLEEEIEELIEENRRLSRRLKQTQFFLEKEQESNDELIEEIKETDEYYQQKLEEK